ncbi:hypothetical protein GIW81_15350 [Hyphomicrobium sp. xq]|uniref:Uncharacterized protein n=1 Tax=Hyphomicrobium album TaxID=2665159 RepID=A0A6I3KIZ1_9HYPH|nr:hypothetical protein [Hyphomicrobium album]MTD95715.1 hypothetical protein [Hyphomicrobium album]
MTKLLTVIAATLVALASVATGAEAAFNVRLAAPAGFNQVHKAGCGGGGGGYRAYRKRVVRQSVRRSAAKVQTASRTIEKPAVVAKAEPKTAPVEKIAQKSAEFENSSISTSKEVAEAVVETPVDVPAKKLAKVAAAPAEEPAQKVAAAIKDIGCKSFFATVGMTLSVPCAK